MARTSRPLEVQFEVDLSLGDEPALPGVCTCPSETPLDRPNGSLGFAQSPANLGQFPPCQLRVPTGRPVPPDLRWAFGLAPSERVLKVPPPPLPSNLTSGVPSQPHEGFRPSKSDPEVAGDLGPDSIPGRGGGSTHGDVDLQRQVPHRSPRTPKPQIRVRPKS